MKGRLLISATALCLCALVVSGREASALDPQSFAEVADGVVKVKASCGDYTELGSGFLVGSSVVMTAHHVIAGCHSVQVLAKGHWLTVGAITNWSDGHQHLDISTMKLPRSVSNAWVFSMRPSQIPIGAYIAALGYPLGEGISETNGRVLARVRGQHIALRILAAQGYSGGPVVDSYGRVVGVVNFGFERPGVFTGAGVGDNIFAYDISSRWGGWRKALCRAYPYGGIEDCPGSSGGTSGGSGSDGSTPPPPPPTTTTSTTTTTPASSGFASWSGAGTYQAGTVFWQYAENQCQTIAYAATCWGVNVYTTTGCNSGLYVSVDLYDGAGNLVDTGINSAFGEQPYQVVLLQASSFVTTVSQFKVTEIDCFNF